MSEHPIPADLLTVVLVGDHQTAEHVEMLEGMAAQHDAAIAAVFSYEPGEAADCTDLAAIEALVAALGRAISIRLPIWIPYPREDLIREQHFRRISLVLQRHGLDLLTGAHLTPCPTTGGISEIDFALRSEVQAIDSLDRAALAAAGVGTLGREIEEALVAAASSDDQAGSPATQDGTSRRSVWRNSEGVSVVSTDTGLEIRVSPPAVLPAPDAPWVQREPALRRYAMWLTHSCGLTQTAVAQCLNPTGHRTPQGCMWKQATVSALLKGRYDRAPRRSERRRLRRAQ
jgi:hypothetical protein